MTTSQLQILQHSLGCDQFGKTTYRGSDGPYYRNRYVIGAGADSFDECRSLVALGFMIDRGASQLCGGMHVFSVTPEGAKAMRTESPRPPKLSRSQERYRRYLRVADCFASFREFLRYEGREKRASA